MCYAHQQTFRPQQPCDDLAPWFFSHRNQQLDGVALDKGEGPVKRKLSLAMREHRDHRQSSS